MSEIQAGTTVWNEHGHEAVYIAPSEKGHFVRYTLEDPDTGDMHPGNIDEWLYVYSKPLELKVDPMTVRLTEERVALQKEVWGLREEMRAAKDERNDLIKVVRETEALRRIRDYLDGKFGYFLTVDSWSGPEILTQDEFLKSDDRYDKNLKLLSLFGDSNGDLAWRVNHYKDGSGSWVQVYPFATKEEAVKHLQSLYEGHVEKWRSKKSWSGRAVFSWPEKYPDLITAPPDVQEHMATLESDALTKEIDELTAALAEKMSRLAEVEVRGHGSSNI